MALNKIGRRDAALANHDASHGAHPNHARALQNKANALVEIEQFGGGAATVCDKIPRGRSGAAPEAHNTRGVALGKLGRYGRRFGKLRPRHRASTWTLSTRSPTAAPPCITKRHEEALASYELALAVQPDYAAARLNRGNTFRELRRFDEGPGRLRGRRWARQAELGEAHPNCGNVLHELKKHQEALARWLPAYLAVQPDLAAAYVNRGQHAARAATVR